jgi:hypothetical protein
MRRLKIGLGRFLDGYAPRTNRRLRYTPRR